jgi:hypothetical protein
LKYKSIYSTTYKNKYKKNILKCNEKKEKEKKDNVCMSKKKDETLFL